MRTLIERTGFKFATANAEGKACCAGDSIEVLCAECREAARKKPKKKVLRMTIESQFARLAPPPPSIVDLIRIRRR